MKNRYITTIFSILIYALATTQVCQSQGTKGKVLDSLQQLYIFNPDLQKQIEKNLLQQYHKTNDKELWAFLDLLKFIGLEKNSIIEEKFRNEIGIKYKAFPNIQAKAYQMIGFNYFVGVKNYEKAFDAYLHLEKLLDMYSPSIITNYAKYCGEIATAYYKFKNYKKAIDLGKKGIKYATDKWDFYNTIGLCYGELAQPDSSMHYLKKAVDEAINMKKPDVYRTISLGNIGYSYYRQKKFELAKPLLKADLDGALRIDDKGLAAGAAIPLADIYLSEKNWASADSLLDMSRNYITKSNQLERLERLFPILSKYHQLMGDSQQALSYRDSTIRAIKRNDSVFNGLLVMRVQQRSDLAKLTEEKNKLENYRKISETRLWAICIIFILIATTFFIIRRYRNHLEKDKKRIEELNRVLALRQRLSADMHDDIGSTLSSISLYTHSLLIQPQVQLEQQKVILNKIKQNAQNIQESMSDIIWSVNPEMDLMGQMIARMRGFGADMTEHSGIAFTFTYDDEVEELKMEMSIRRNLYLIYKEAINNAVKYSCCKHITVTLKINHNELIMEIADNGVGFDTEMRHLGNGLINMRRRSNEINAQLVVVSSSQKGTLVTLILPRTTNG